MIKMCSQCQINPRLLKKSSLCRKCDTKRLRKYNIKPRERHPIYSVWRAMKQRCYNHKLRCYHNYGGRGITVCDRWLGKEGFRNFSQDMGPKPGPEYSIERIYNDGNYEPSNCKWATPKEQGNNRRSSRLVRINISENSPIYLSYGNLSTLKEFSEYYKIPLIIVKYRYAQHANEDWILHADNDNRNHLYKGLKYNTAELSILSGKPYSKLYHQLITKQRKADDILLG